jgi:uncharacterized membrane protein YoaK (UPF0700 family)
MAPDSLFHRISDAHVTHVLAFVGGYVDAAGFLKLQGIFTSSITGNLVVTCASSVASMDGVFCRSSVSIAFFLAGGFGAAMALQIKLSEIMSLRSTARLLFSLEALTLFLVWIVGLQMVT